jgi:hypothetical protein
MGDRGNPRGSSGQKALKLFEEERGVPVNFGPWFKTDKAVRPAIRSPKY